MILRMKSKTYLQFKRASENCIAVAHYGARKPMHDTLLKKALATEAVV